MPTRPMNIRVTPSSPAPPSGLLTTDDVSYLGMFRLPATDNITYFLSLSNAALSGRVVGSDIHIFITGTYVLGAGVTEKDEVYEFVYPGTQDPVLADAPIAALSRKWGDVYHGKRLTVGDTDTRVRGLMWVEGNGLLWAYGDNYAVGGYHNPSIGLSTLNDGTGVSLAYGPWRTTEHSQKTRGYMVQQPSTLQVGYGAPITSGNFESPWGAEVCVSASTPTSATPASTTGGSDVAIPTSRVVHHSFTARQDRVLNYLLCGWNCSLPSPPAGCSGVYDSSKGGFAETPPPGFDSLDVISAAAWIETTSKQGILCVGNIVASVPGHVYGDGGSVAHRWYGPTQSSGHHECVHGQNDGQSSGTGEGAETKAIYWWIFDPNNPTTDPTPTPISTWMPTHNPIIDWDSYQFGGAWFEPTSRLLFVSDSGADHIGSYIWQPVVHVFQVSA